MMRERRYGWRGSEGVLSFARAWHRSTSHGGGHGYGAPLKLGEKDERQSAWANSVVDGRI